MSLKTSRRRLIKAGGLAATGLALSGWPLLKKARAAERPNFLFILTDDQRHDALSAAGHPFLRTPNIDWLAKTGARFTNAFVTTSLCSPSRASFLTGQYAHRHGVLNNLTPWNEQNTTFLELMKKSGYYTGFIGKWHMPGKGLPDLAGQGKVDEFISFTAVAGQGVYWNCPLVRNGRSMKKDGYISEVLNGLAIDFLRQARGRNFCLCLSHKAAHAPFQAPEAYRGIYDQEDLRLPPEYLAHGLNFKFCAPHSSSGILRRGTMEDEYRRYCETLKALDDSLARVFEELAKLKLLEQTVIIFAGDNGYLWGEHKLVDKRFAYEESIRIPLLVRAPGIVSSPGQNIDRMVLNIDLAPTLLELAGLPVPGEMQGVSFRPLLEGKNVPWRKSFLYEYPYDPPYALPGLLAVRTETMKLVKYEKNKLPDELYDIENDPRELSSLSSNPAHADRKRQLQTELERLALEAGLPRNSALGRILED